MLHYGSLKVSAVPVGELFTWGKRARTPAYRLVEIEQFLATVEVFDINQEVAEKFGEIRAGLFDRGRPIGELDLLNASVALVHNLTIITHNIVDYQDVPGLAIVDWMIP